ncbi:hypothetical protein THAOC_27226, partial [Thalassiosira oceanica]
QLITCSRRHASTRRSLPLGPSNDSSSEAETAAPEGERECAGDAVDASRAATEPSRHPISLSILR